MSTGSSSISQRSFASFHRGSPSVCAMWTPQCGEKKGGLCFVKRKDKSFLSNEKSFIERKWGEKLGWTRCMRKVVDFLSILLCFGGKTLSFLTKVACLFFARHSRYFPHACRCAGADTRSCIAHSASLKYLPSPFTFTTNWLIYSLLCMKGECFLLLRR